MYVFYAYRLYFADKDIYMIRYFYQKIEIIRVITATDIFCSAPPPFRIPRPHMLISSACQGYSFEKFPLPQASCCMLYNIRTSIGSDDVTMLRLQLFFFHILRLRHIHVKNTELSHWALGTTSGSARDKFCFYCARMDIGPELII